MSFAKARFEGIAKVKNNFTRLKPPNTAACNFYNADKGNSEGKVGTHMSVAKNALYTRGFAAVGISVACMLAAACLAAGVPCNQVAYASETESQSQTANAQNAQSSSYLYAVRDSETNLWGFVDAAGTQVIPCQFESLGSLPGQSPSLVTTYSSNNGTKSYSPILDAPMICRAA